MSEEKKPVRHGYILEIGYQLRCPECREIHACHTDKKTFIGTHTCRWCETPFVMESRDL